MEITSLYLKLFLVFLQCKIECVRMGEECGIMEILTVSLLQRQYMSPRLDNASLCHYLPEKEKKRYEKEFNLPDRKLSQVLSSV